MGGGNREAIRIAAARNIWWDLNGTGSREATSYLYRYVTQRRLIAGKTLIEKGLLMENEALQTGFRDHSGFYRAFKQEYGISPRQYRNMHFD